MNRYKVNEQHKLEDDCKISVYGKIADDGQVMPAKTFCIQMGSQRLWVTPEQLDLIVRNNEGIREFAETHRDLVMGAGERKAELKARREAEEAKRKEEARLKHAAEAAAVEGFRKLFASADPQKLAVLSELFKNAG